MCGGQQVTYCVRLTVQNQLRFIKSYYVTTCYHVLPGHLTGLRVGSHSQCFPILILHIDMHFQQDITSQPIRDLLICPVAAQYSNIPNNGIDNAQQLLQYLPLK